MTVNGKLNRLTAEDVLRRYKEESIPAFEGIELNNVNQVGLFDERPLHVACSRGIMEEVAALVEAGADLNAPGDVGYTPLHEAVSANHSEVVRYLLDHGASLDIKNEFGETPLDIAKIAKRKNMMKLLDR
jgi:ankyrin repeat protein